jgi:hypothetical protein
MPATSAIAVVPQAFLIAARLGDQRTSAMAADIVEGAYPSVSAPHDQQCRVEPRQLAYEIVARPRNTVVVADRQPCAAEDSGEFLLEVLLREDRPNIHREIETL